ncbi:MULTISPECIES: winged helix-turn-helix domain-containing protein [unclassified Fusibacter]|uniref:winged helix-turn-helix domain-containing protein n=1 Tax=unclassified Fusibacter TaxID=2624464 RepID=UPI0010133377|nr:MULTISPECIES: winged helix-turn-helix domain-containing protein [unclassified Fusibacter]MCK8060316.1 winged helix-turn-helix domain-containing protein [Fusibacter sp. A2]NPE20395.1 winged helix-turn-helix transcriptional regulator [Fusibacter sp. A1]RXV63599.1 ArsR family transcriptional regulator [Fusibacter sp. A1]
MIRIRRSELLEFKCFLDRLAFERNYFAREDITLHNEALVSLMAEMDEHVTGFLMSEVQYFSRILLANQMMHQCGMIEQMPTVEAFLNHVKGLSEKQAKDLYLTSIIERSTDDPLDEVLKDLEEDDYLVHVEVRPKDIIEFVQEFDHLYDRLITYFERMYKQVFEPFKDRIMDILDVETRKFEEWHQRDPDQFVKVLYKMNTQKVVDGTCDSDFYVSVAYPGNISFTMVKNQPESLYVNFGYAVADFFKATNSETMIKLIGEATKMSILKLLAVKPMYQSELAQELELNRATIGHHISQLTEVGVIQIAYSKGNRAYYEINIERIRDGFNQFVITLCDSGGACDE